MAHQALRQLISNLSPSRIIGIYQSLYMARKQERFMQDFTPAQAMCEFDRNLVYEYFHHYYFNLLDQKIKKHREYFKKDMRGFGEDAMHAMWYVLFKTYRPKRCLEIGVYRGQTISLWRLISTMLDLSSEIHGISPFDSSSDEVSYYDKKIDYASDTILNHKNFQLSIPSLIKSYSQGPLAKTLIKSKRWDLIYIDGSHDYDVVLSDYRICRDNLADGGLLVIDDSSLYQDYQPPLFAFPGHPGPSRVVIENAMNDLAFICGVGHNNIFMK